MSNVKFDFKRSESAPITEKTSLSEFSCKAERKRG